MLLRRRNFLAAGFASMASGSQSSAALQPDSSESTAPGTTHGIPGAWPGRVIAVSHPGSIIANGYQREPVRQMIRKGMMQLTGADTPEDAWRAFFQPGDIVGVKLNPVGRPHVFSAPEVLHEIVAGLRSAGIKPAEIVAFDRYRKEFLEAGFDKWLPGGVRWTYATDKTGQFQLDMDGYEPDQYMEMALVLPDANPANPHHRRSYVARFLTRDINKMINLCVLKHHQSAGVTLALKNMSHGLVNNVSRSHSSPSRNSCGTFIPAVVDLPVIREKAVLHILDGVKGAYHGGPGSKVAPYVWNHNTMYFATDPVALDKIGWRVLDEKRAAMGMLPVSDALPDDDSRYKRMQPEHVDLAGLLGLGIADPKKIDLQEFRLG